MSLPLNREADDFPTLVRVQKDLVGIQYTAQIKAEETYFRPKKADRIAAILKDIEEWKAKIPKREPLTIEPLPEDVPRARQIQT